MSEPTAEQPRGPRFTVVTIFPEMVHGYLQAGVLGRAVERGVVTVNTVDPRDFTTDRYRSVDDTPFGGGAGMVMTPGPLARAIESVGPVDRRVFLTPNGRPFRQQDAVDLAGMESVVLLCGRYEGIDERVIETCIDDSISIGDYVLSGGELAALVVLDAAARLVPGVLGNEVSSVHESFSDGLLEHPHYTRPGVWRGQPVPEVLLSGHHANIDAWRRQASLRRTAAVRPDLFQSAPLTAADREILTALRGEDEES